MKKLILLSGIMLLLLNTSQAAVDQTTFINKVEDSIYQGSRSGKLTKREVRALQDEVHVYERTLWKYEKNGKLSKRERKKLHKVEIALERKLEIALRNQERVRGAKQKGKATGVKSKKGKRNNGPICRMPSKKQESNKY